MILSSHIPSALGIDDTKNDDYILFCYEYTKAIPLDQLLLRMKESSSMRETHSIFRFANRCIYK